MNNCTWLLSSLDGLVPSTACFKILLHLGSSDVDHGGIFDCAWHRNLFCKLSMYPILDQFSEHASQGLPRSCLGDHALSLDDASDGCKGAHLPAHERLDLQSHLAIGHNGGLRVASMSGGDKCEWQLSLELVGDTDDAGFRYEWMG